MKLADLATMPLRWRAVRSPAIQMLLVKERLQSGLAVDPFSPAFRDDPYPTVHEVRRRDPVHWLETARGWFVTRYDDVSALLRDPRCSADRTPPAHAVDSAWRRESELHAVVETTMLGLDPPDHTRLRNLVNLAFTPRVVADLRPRVERLTEEHLDALAAADAPDVMQDLAEPLPVRVIAELLGAPPGDHARFRRWASDLARALDPAFHRDVIERADRAVVEMRSYFRPLLAERRSEPRDDLLSALVQAETEGDRLSEEELYSFCILLLAAGSETTTNLIGNGLLALLRHPDQLATLQDQPGLIDSAVEELLRYDSPLQATTRRALESFELRGKRIREGDLLVLSLAGANRDPARFDDPDRLDVRRDDNRHLAFGLGVHYCVGAPLARVEGQVVFARLLERFPKLQLVPSKPPIRRDTLVLRGLSSLPVQT